MYPFACARTCCAASDFYFSFRWNAIAKNCGLLLPTGRLRWCRFPQRRRTHRRHGRRNTRSRRAKAQLLKSFRIEFSRRIQPMRFLEFSRRFHRRSVPLPVRFSSKGAVFRERLLDLGNAVGSGHFLPPLPTLRFFRGPRPVRGVGRLGRDGFLLCRALRLRRSCTHTEPRCHEQRQGQVGRFSHSHRCLYWLSLNRYC
jgi:hypothetical protein